MSKCSRCGSELAEGAKFCGECGAKVTSVHQCPKCGCELSTGAKFCGECGFRLQQQEDVPGNNERKQSDSVKTNEGIDWDSAVTMADGSMPLTDDQVEAVAFSLSRLSLRRSLKTTLGLCLWAMTCLQALLLSKCLWA